jgi:hypothetical protein
MKCLFFFLLIPFIGLSQTRNVQWGDINSTYRFGKIIQNEEGNYYAIRRENDDLFNLTDKYKTTLFFIRGITIEKSMEIQLSANGIKGEYEGITLINNELVVFFSTEENRMIHIFQQTFSENLTSLSAAIEIASFEDPKGLISNNSIEVLATKQGKFGGVSYTIDDNRNKKLTFGYAILDSSKNVVSTGQQTLPVDRDYLAITNFQLSEDGVLYVSVNESVSAMNKRIRNGFLSYLRIGFFGLMPVSSFDNFYSSENLQAIKAIHIYQCLNNRNTPIVYPLPKTTINNYKLLINTNNQVSLVGSFQRFKDDKIKNRSEFTMNGLFSIFVDFQNLRVSASNFIDLAKNVYTYGLSDRKKQRFENNLAAGKLLPNLLDYRLKNVQVLPNGSILGYYEQIIRYETTTSNYNGGIYGNYGPTIGLGYPQYGNTMTTNITYNFNHILVFCLNADGTSRWMKKIQKGQSSSYYSDPFVSCYNYLKGNQTEFLFTDNPKNYAENGVFISDKPIHSNPLLTKNNIITRVSINVETGETKREIFLPKSENEGYYNPRDFMYNPINNSLLIMSLNGAFSEKIRIGTLPLN